MKIRTFLTAVCTMLCALSLTAAAPEQVQPMPVDASELKLKLTTDKSPVSYKAGDTIKFVITKTLRNMFQGGSFCRPGQ